MAFLELDLSNFSPKGDAELPTFQGRSRGVEICEIDPDGEEVHEEALNKASEIEVGHGWL